MRPKAWVRQHLGQLLSRQHWRQPWRLQSRTKCPGAVDAATRPVTAPLCCPQCTTNGAGCGTKQVGVVAAGMGGSRERRMVGVAFFQKHLNGHNKP